MADSHDLLVAARRGDVAAVETLVARHLPGLEAYVRRRAGRLVTARESASDLVQSACREVFAHLDRFRYDGEEGFRRWLYATALRKMRDRQRRYGARKREVGREVRLQRPEDSRSSGLRYDELIESCAGPSTVAARSEQVARVNGALRRLPERDRRVIEMAYAESLSRAEMARRLGVTESHLRVLLSRALVRLAQRVGER